MNLYSSGKTVGAICMAFMFEQGKIDFNEKVATYWPEFAQNGKENITVADVLRHDANLEKMDTPITFADLQTDKIKQNVVGALIEKMAPHLLSHGGKRNYHAVTKDLITNEIFRRVEPSGRTMGEYFEQEVQAKLGVDVFLRMDQETIARTRDLKNISGWKSFTNGFKSFENGRYVSLNAWDMVCNMMKMMKLDTEVNSTLTKEQRGTQVFDIDGVKEEKDEYVPDAKTGEIISCYSYANARGLGKLAGFMANKGSMGEEKLMEQSTWEEAHSERDFKRAVTLGYAMDFTKGGYAYYDLENAQKQPMDPFWYCKGITEKFDMMTN